MTTKKVTISEGTRAACSGKMNVEIAALVHEDTIPADEAAALLLERATIKAERKGLITTKAAAA